jgi:hypothetical protein|tara:strand:- start:1649 stop:1870 length:222 start_codon:yes stop_codon:yes gene_type:complete
MIKEVAKKLLKLVNVKSNTDLLELYMNDRISIIHKQMEQAPNMQDINQMQGAIKELRRLQTLRDEVIAGAKDG